MLQHPWDYSLHFSVSFIGFFVAYIFLRKVFSLPSGKSAEAATIGIFSIGLFKEFYIDMNVGKTDMVYDIIANSAGIATALFLKFIFTRYYKNIRK
jgi:hypothetical protein